MVSMIKLQLGSQEITVLEYRAILQRDTDTASSMQTYFHLTIESSDEEIWSWAASDLSKDGEILFYSSKGDDSVFRKISFKNARCVMLEETRHSADALRMTTNLVFSAETVISGQATFTDKAMEKSRLYQ